MNSPSLLTQEMLASLLKTARQNIERDGFLTPLIMIRHSASAWPLVVPLNLQKPTEEKREYVARIGTRLALRGRQIIEAVMLSEVWFVNTRTAPATSIFAPSAHPSRQEAIVMTGRNRDKSKTTCVLQPFTRDKDDKPIWIPIADAISTRPDENALSWVGLLDELFVADRR